MKEELRRLLWSRLLDCRTAYRASVSKEELADMSDLWADILEQYLPCDNWREIVNGAFRDHLASSTRFPACANIVELCQCEARRPCYQKEIPAAGFRKGNEQIASLIRAAVGASATPRERAIARARLAGRFNLN